MKTLLPALLLAASLGCDRTPVDTTLADARAQVASVLKDPASAQFRNVEAFPYFGGRMVCGEVNAKNSFGGYAGFTHFSVARAAAGSWQPAQVTATQQESDLSRASCQFWRGYVRSNGLADRMPSAEEQAVAAADYRLWARDAAAEIVKASQ